MTVSPFVIAHQGASGHAPSNTFAAFRRAVEMGADIIEIDVVTTADGAVVVSHDTTVDRRTTGTGRIDEMTLEEIKQLDAGTPFDPRFSDERIPTLAETLEWAVTQTIRFCIEIKGDSIEQYCTTARCVVPLLRRNRYLQRSTITSFNPDCLRLLKSLEPMVSTALDPDKQDGTYTPWELVCKARVCSADFLLHRHKTLSSKMIEEIHHHGMSVWAWTANTVEDMRHAITTGADGVMTNFPDVLRRVIEESES